MTPRDSGGVPDALERKISALIKEKFLEVRGELDADNDLFGLGLDSMGIMQLIISLEETFGARIPGESVTQDNFRTTRRIADLVRKLTPGEL